MGYACPSSNHCCLVFYLFTMDILKDDCVAARGFMMSLSIRLFYLIYGARSKLDIVAQAYTFFCLLGAAFISFRLINGAVRIIMLEENERYERMRNRPWRTHTYSPPRPPPAPCGPLGVFCIPRKLYLTMPTQTATKLPLTAQWCHTPLLPFSWYSLDGHLIRSDIVRDYSMALMIEGWYIQLTFHFPGLVWNQCGIGIVDGGVV